MTKQRISLTRMGNNHSSGAVTHHHNNNSHGHIKEHPHHNNFHHHQHHHSHYQISGYSSTRPFKFCEDEKVLCYEPDPTKAKVLYDSKVLEVVVRKDTRGRRLIEYLIHFQGWNSSWDRCVAEEFVLKDTEENRQLQNDLNEKANTLKQTLNKGKKRRAGKSNASSSVMSDGGDDSSKSSWSGEDSSEPETTSDDEESRKEAVQMVIPEELKRKLEDDYFSIKADKWVRLPCKTTVVHILEDYVKYFGFSEIKAWSEGQKSKKSAATASAATTSQNPVNGPTQAQPAGSSKSTAKGESPTDVGGGATTPNPEDEELNRVFRRISLVKEVVEGIRIMFDFVLGRILLYEEEEEQFAANPPIPTFPRGSVPNLTWSLPKLIGSDGEEIEERFEPPAKRTRASNSADTVCGISRASSTDCEFGIGPGGQSPWRRRRLNVVPTVNIETTDVKLMQYLDKLNDWELIPSHLYLSLRYPCLVYGSVHLLRLFVKMPEVLSKTTIPRRRMKVIVKHMNLFLEYLSKQNYLFGDRLFAPRTRIENEMMENSMIPIENIKKEIIT